MANTEHYYETLSPRLRHWYMEAWVEKGMPERGGQPNPDFALYPARFYKSVAIMTPSKNIDFCFVGAFRFDPETERNRTWIMDYIAARFTERSWLQFTDAKTRASHRRLGSYDHTLEYEGFVPKEVPVGMRNRFDPHFFETMCRSQFTLCPAGDAFWSMRFYEALMCRSIPVVSTRDETFRSRAESRIDYRYYLTTEEPVFRQDWADHNYALFLKHHTLDAVPAKSANDPISSLAT